MWAAVLTLPSTYPSPLVPAGIPLAVASRACNIGLCSRIINTWREHPLPPNLQKMLLAVGLRGAVAYGLGELVCCFAGCWFVVARLWSAQA